MALINCSECGKQVSDKAVACPHCGCPVSEMNLENKEPVKNQNTSPEKEPSLFNVMVIFIVIVLIFVAVFSISNSTSSNKPRKTSYNTFSQRYAVTSDNKLQDLNDLQKYIDGFKQYGYITKFEVENHHIYVNRSLWDTSTIDQKKLFAKCMAQYCEIKNNKSTEYVTVYDGSSGRKLADVSGGFFHISTK